MLFFGNEGWDFHASTATGRILSGVVTISDETRFVLHHIEEKPFGRDLLQVDSWCIWREISGNKNSSTFAERLQSAGGSIMV